MLTSLVSFLKSGFDDQTPESRPHRVDEISLAAAVLLVEAAMMEGTFGDDERQTIERLLAGRFELDDDALRQLMDEAVAKQKDAVEIHSFTNVLKQNYSEDERCQIMEMLWEVAYADGVLHDYEAHLLRHVGGLIHVSDRARGDARKRVLDRMGIDPDF